MPRTENDRLESTGNAIRITVVLPDPVEARELLDSLLGHVNAIEGGELHLSTTDSGDTATVTVGGLTRKQRCAVRTAVGLGYYEEPRTATLGDVATELGISNSGASSRLRTVERKVIVALAERLEG